jgi:hypothetical protein
MIAMMLSFVSPVPDLLGTASCDQGCVANWTKPTAAGVAAILLPSNTANRIRQIIYTIAKFHK